MSALHLNSKGKSPGVKGITSQPSSFPEKQVRQMASEEVIDQLKDHLKTKYKNSYSEVQVEEIISRFLSDYLREMIHKEPSEV